MSGVDNGDVLLDLSGGSYTNVKGNITRASHGELNMQTASTINFIGDTQQFIPSQTKTGTTDLFNYSNLIIPIF